MKLHERVKTIREGKKYSQEHMAFELGLSQSQYSRRENGEIKFDTDEIFKISKILDTKISELFGEETNVFSIHTQKGGVFGQFVTIPDKLIELYEKRIADKDEMIEILKKQMNEEN